MLSNKTARRVLLALVLTFTFSMCNFQFIKVEGEKPLVVCTTTVLSSIVRDLAGDKVKIDVIASPAVCPAHYDVKPSDVEAFKEAELILMHGFEPWVSELKQASGSAAPVLKIKGSWNNPEALKKLYSEVSQVLSQNLGINLSMKLKSCLRSIEEVNSWLKNFANKNSFKGKPVACMMFQKGYINFLGFKVVAVYPPPETVSAKQYESIIRNMTENHAVLVVDNMQSGSELGKKIASETGAVEIALSNFPGTAPKLNNMTEVMKWNAEKIAEALETAEVRGELNNAIKKVEEWRTATFAASIIAIIELIVLAALILRRRR